ncbi:hypothetical protein D3C78_1325080 [compost metagenome]
MIGLGLGRQQGLARDDVVLHVPALVHLEEGAQQAHQLGLVPLVLQARRAQLLVEQHPAEDGGGGQLAQRIEHGGGAEAIRTRGRAGPFRQRGTGVAAVRGGLGGRPEGHVGGDGGGAGVVGAADGTPAEAGVVQPLELIDVALVGAHQQQIHLVQIVAVLGGGVGEALAQLLPRQSGEVLLQCLGQHRLIDDALLEHQLLHRRQAVAEVRYSHLQA